MKAQTPHQHPLRSLTAARTRNPSHQQMLSVIGVGQGHISLAESGRPDRSGRRSPFHGSAVALVIVKKGIPVPERIGWTLIVRRWAQTCTARSTC